jgi:hypothetical protein
MDLISLTRPLTLVCLAPALIQGLLMAVDEFHFHHARGLGAWERRGHPLDTLATLACFALPALFPFDATTLAAYVGLCVFSCLLVTKDEWVHARECGPGEHWLHAALFVVHPLVFTGFGVLWYAGESGVAAMLARGQIALMAAFLAYQIIFWVALGKGRWPDPAAR